MYNSLPYLTFPMLLPISRNKKNWAQVLNLYSSIHPFIQQILSTSYVPDIFPGIGTTEMLFSCSVVSDSCDSMICSTLGFLVLHHLPELAQTHVHWVSDAVQLSYPLSSPCPPAFNLSQHQSPFQRAVLNIRWPKYWSFSFRISVSNEYSGLISFRVGWLDLLAVQ